MIITTARKPSSKTRIFCKHLAGFTGWEYVTRGKASLSTIAEKPFLLVGEHRGNPGSLKFFVNGRCILSIHANVSLDREVEKGGAPVIEGESPLAHALSRATGLKIGDGSERVIHIDDEIEFVDKGEAYIVLNVLAMKFEDGVKLV